MPDWLCFEQIYNKEGVNEDTTGKESVDYDECCCY